MGKLANFTIEEIMIFTATIIASLGVCLKICFTSKCKKINICFGMFSCDRDVSAVIKEEQIELEKIKLKNKNQSSPKSLSEPEPEDESLFA